MKNSNIITHILFLEQFVLLKSIYMLCSCCPFNLNKVHKTTQYTGQIKYLKEKKCLFIKGKNIHYFIFIHLQRENGQKRA